jgi:hypothetical protein
MMADLQGYAGQCTLGSLAPRPLGQCLIGSPPRPLSYTGSGQLPAHPSLQTLPLSSLDFPCGPLSLPSCSYISGCFRLVAQSAATCLCWFLDRGLFYPEDGGDTFSKMSVHIRSTRRHIQEDGILHPTSLL